MANPLTEEVGPLKAWQWGAAALAAYVVYRWYQSRQASSAATAALGTTSGLPSTSAGTDTGASTQTTPQSWAQWLHEALSAATNAGLSPTQAYNDFTQWINGGCVSSQGAGAIGNAIQTLGLPPGFGIPPAISICVSNSNGGTSAPGTHTQPYIRQTTQPYTRQTPSPSTLPGAGQTAVVSSALSAFERWIKTPGAAAYYDIQEGNLLYLPGGAKAAAPANANQAAFDKWIVTPGAAAYYAKKTGSHEFDWLIPGHS
jgi:hypothetical protein